MTKRTHYGKETFRALLDFEDSRLGNRHELREVGVFVRPLASSELTLTPSARALRLAHPSGNLDAPALPFPFDDAQFRTFCESCPMFADDIEMQYCNDDGTEDLRTIADLRKVSAQAADLVETYLRTPKLRVEMPESAPVKFGDPRTHARTAGGRVHSTRQRSNVMATPIAMAIDASTDPSDTNAVWAALESMADQRTPVPPLRCVIEGGIEYIDNGKVIVFTKRKLRDRLRRVAR